MKKKYVITQNMIKALNPCKDRLDNFLKHYEGRKFTRGQFMGLKNITQSDKIWVAFRLMPKDNIRFAAADIAESVLHIFEANYPEDDRPRKAIEAARTGVSIEAAATAARYAACTSNTAAVYGASNSYIAALAAHSAAFAAHSAYSIADSALATALHAIDTAMSAPARRTQEKLIRKIVLKYWR